MNDTNSQNVKDEAKQPSKSDRRKFLAGMGGLVASASMAPAAGVGQEMESGEALVLKAQGSFAFGGTVVTSPGTFDPTAFISTSGNTLHGDHGYVQFQIPPSARALPLVMWHGGGQFSKTWESTPDGRDGYQTIFLRRGWAVYILDQPRRGRAGQTTVGTTITPGTVDQSLFAIFRLGIWPNFYTGVQFSQSPGALDQYWRQVTPNTGPETTDLVSDAVAALFNKIGPAVLINHSQSGKYGWPTAMKSPNVKAIISYEPTSFVFPEGEAPGPVPTAFPEVAGITAPVIVPPADFNKLTKIPIQIVYGDNIPTTPSQFGDLELWRVTLVVVQQFADAVNRHGGDASILHLPEIGIYGNTHFAFSDLNNLEIADLLSHYLHEKGLDKRGASA
jgi:hypothetical protein